MTKSRNGSVATKVWGRRVRTYRAESSVIRVVFVSLIVKKVEADGNTIRMIEMGLWLVHNIKNYKNTSIEKEPFDVTSSGIPPSWDALYEQWKQRRLPSLLEKDWKTAFADYPWISFTASPFVAFSKPLNQSRIAIISSGGLSLTTQVPYDAEDPFGDHSFRVITAPIPLPSWQVNHGHYDTKPVQVDYNTVFPLDILARLAQNGYIGSLATENYTFMGYQPNPRPFYVHSAPQILEGLRAQSVDAVLLIPG